MWGGYICFNPGDSKQCTRSDRKHIKITSSEEKCYTSTQIYTYNHSYTLTLIQTQLLTVKPFIINYKCTNEGENACVSSPVISAIMYATSLWKLRFLSSCFLIVLPQHWEDKEKKRKRKVRKKERDKEVSKAVSETYLTCVCSGREGRCYRKHELSCLWLHFWSQAKYFYLFCQLNVLK